MIPSDIDIASLSGEVNADGVAATDPALDSAIQGLLVDAQKTDGISNVGVVVLDKAPRIKADTRDIATAIGNETGKTIVVRTPGGAGTYSTEFSRSELEVAQSHMLQQPDYVEGFSVYLDNLAKHDDTPWTAVNVGAVVVLIAVVAVCIAALRRKATLVKA